MDKSRVDIHNFDRRIELALNSIKSGAFPQKNREAILDFCDYCFAEGLGVERVEHLARMLKKVAEDCKKEFEEVTKEDAIQLLGRIESKKLSLWTKHDYRVALKKFFRWLRKSENYPEEVSWIKTAQGMNSRKLPEELLSEKDIKQLVATSSDPQTKAIVAVLWDAGLRIGELLTMKIRHVEPEKNYARIIVEGKTGMRRLIITYSWPYLIQWLNLHPLKDDNSAPLWLKRNNESMNYVDARKRLSSLARKAKIRKKIYPHLFRHSRATFMASKLTEAEMSQFFGWIPGTKMAATYVHLSSRDIEGTLLKLAGLEKESNEDKPILKPAVCWRCKSVNPADASVCMKCGVLLDTVHAAKNPSTTIENAKLQQTIEELEGQIADQQDFQTNILTPLVEWASNQGFRVPEDFCMIRDITPERWKKKR